MAFLDLDDRSGRIQLQASRDVLGDEAFERLINLDLGDLLGADGTVFRTRRGELTHRGQRLDAARQVAAPAAREAPRADGHRDALQTSRARPDVQRGDARHVHRARQDRQRHPPLPRRGRLHRGRDPDPAAALRRRAGQAVRDALQRARPHDVPADRHRALPQAPDRRRAGARLRDRQELPQRGPDAQAQPRVHRARVVRGLRRLAGRRRPLRAADRLRGARSSAASASRRPGRARRSRARSAPARASTSSPTARSSRCSRRCASTTCTSRRTSPPGRRSSTIWSRSSSSRR